MNLEKYYEIRYNFFKWRTSQGVVVKTIMSLAVAAMTGIMAQIVIPLPWTPVPITGQTFAVLLSGVILGRYWGGISQLFYVILGAAGISWFAGAKGGITVLLGATGGYLIGFILASLFIGHFIDRYISARKFKHILILMLIANFVLIYVPGAIGLAFWQMSKGIQPTIWNILAMGILPFIPGDLIKIFGVSIVTKAIVPKEAYGDEIDRRK
ncbi:BioY protein [Methanothermus fervidus DSM 2088]|uniref:BioY protein n=1 Tax=Methanothermus fervidus (strain ATCC 43054 / DSM 2088 / JCM 10308 / V24 S) TaxID=523846 RepID=E3GXT3_METFV|nr:biotin transporter BioY [Methanothermus fervidus]ADP77115.1 BioY protein [Methanothermus fervidus DSM 2088]